MASTFVFAEGERVDAEAKRVARAGAVRVIAAIERADSQLDERDELVHDARRTLKRLRALLASCRATSSWGVCCAMLRDRCRRRVCGGGGSHIRPSLAVGDADEARNRALLAHARCCAERVDSTRAVASVRAFLAALDGWQVASGRKELQSGLRRSYRGGRRALRRARRSDDPEALHTLRKRCRDLQHELALLGDLAPRIAKKFGAATRELGEAARC